MQGLGGQALQAGVQGQPGGGGQGVMQAHPRGGHQGLGRRRKAIAQAQALQAKGLHLPGGGRQPGRRLQLPELGIALGEGVGLPKGRGVGVGGGGGG